MREGEMEGRLSDIWWTISIQWSRLKQQHIILCILDLLDFVMRSYGKIWCNQTGHRLQCVTCTFYAYKHTLRIRNAYCFSAVTMVRRRRLNVEFLRTMLVWLLQLPVWQENMWHMNCASLESIIVTWVSIYFWSCYILWPLI